MKFAKTTRTACAFIAILALSLACIPSFIALAQNTKVYFPQGGDTLEVASGGTINIQTGASIKYNGLSSSGVVKAGTVTLDGSNPTPVTTGLNTVVTGGATLKSATTPGDDPTYFTVDYNGSNGTLNIYAWKNTGGTDPTLVASTNNSATVDWIAVGN
jgi:hypothetical protein